MDRAVKNNCNVVKMINQRGRSQSIKKMLSLDMGLPRASGTTKPKFTAFATANRRTFARFRIALLHSLSRGFSVSMGARDQTRQLMISLRP
jgi:hypothetical protein